MNLIGIASKFVANKGGEIAAKVLEGADNLFTSKEEKMEMALKIEQEVNRRDEAERTDILETLKVEFAETSNARAMQIAALGQESWLAKHFVYLLAGFIVFIATLFGIMLFYIPVPEKNLRMVEMFTDIYLFAGAMMVLQFFFGSSVGSRRNSEAIRKELHKATDK